MHSRHRHALFSFSRAGADPRSQSPPASSPAAVGSPCPAATASASSPDLRLSRSGHSRLLATVSPLAPAVPWSNSLRFVASPFGCEGLRLRSRISLVRAVAGATRLHRLHVTHQFLQI